jgi:hypothetical protein
VAYDAEDAEGVPSREVVGVARASNAISPASDESALSSLATSSGEIATPTSESSPPQEITTLRINSGGGAEGSFAADTYFSDGETDSTTLPIDTSDATNPAPQEVYQSERWGSSFSYTIPNLTVGASYIVRLHFAETQWSSPGQRKFHVFINGKQVLNDFDIVAAAGAPFKANVQQLTTVADNGGQITIQYLQGSSHLPKSCGIEITQ